MALTTKFLMKVNEYLETKGFSAFDFNVRNTKTHPVTLTIEYLYIPKFYFRAVINDDQFEIKYNPGEITQEVNYSSQTTMKFYNHLRNWLNNITSELESSPMARRLDEHEHLLKNFQSRINELEDNNKLFSAQESAEIVTRLDELEASFREHLEKDMEEKREHDQQLRNLESEIEALKAQLGVLSKKNWFLSFSTKLYMWTQRNPESVRQVVGASRALLPDEVQEVVTDDALDLLLLPQNEASATEE